MPEFRNGVEWSVQEGHKATCCNSKGASLEVIGSSYRGVYNWCYVDPHGFVCVQIVTKW